MKKNILYINGNLFPAISGDTIYSQGLLLRLCEVFNLEVCAYGKKEDIQSSILKNKKISYSLILKSKLKSNKLLRFLKYRSIKQVYSNELNQIILNKISKNDYNFIILDHLRTFSLLKDNLHLVDRKKTKIIYVAHNIEIFNYYESIKYQTNYFKKFLFWILDFNLNNLEKKLLNTADITWALTNEDIIELKKISNKSNFKFLTPYFNWSRIKNNLNTGSKNLLILGSMDWYPNIIGCLDFVENVFRRLIKLDNNYKLFIVGNRPDKKILALNSDNIFVTGRVESVDPYILKSDLLVLPNRHGSGIKVKILESVMKGLPVVTFSQNVPGYSSNMLKYPFVVSTNEEFLKAIQLVISETKLKNEFIQSFTFTNQLSSELFKIKNIC